MPSRIKVYTSILSGACLMLIGPSVFRAFAQSTKGSVSVSVVDPSGAAVPEAVLDLVNVDSNDSRKAVTSGAGTYVFPDLTFGRYKLTISKSGFTSKTYESIEVQTARVTDIIAKLTLGATTETVTVAGGEAPGVDATSSQISDTIDTKQVGSLPVNGRNVMGFAFLVPGGASTGITNATTGAFNTTGTWNNMPGGAVVGADFDGTPGSATVSAAGDSPMAPPPSSRESNAGGRSST